MLNLILKPKPERESKEEGTGFWIRMCYGTYRKFDWSRDLFTRTGDWRLEGDSGSGDVAGGAKWAAGPTTAARAAPLGHFYRSRGRHRSTDRPAHRQFHYHSAWPTMTVPPSDTCLHVVGGGLGMGICCGLRAHLGRSAGEQAKFPDQAGIQKQYLF